MNELFIQAKEEAKQNPNGNAYDLVPEDSEIPKEASGKDPTVHIKLFTAMGSWTWLLMEYDREAKIAFGYAYDAMHPYSAELGGVSIGELEALVGPLGLPAVERDLWFEPMPLSEAIKRWCP